MQKEEGNGIAILTPEQSQLDALSAEEFRRQCSEALDGEARAVLDLSAVQFIDSSGLGVILGLVRGMHEKGGTIVVCAVNPPVQALFRMVRMANIVEICSDRESALALMRNT